MTKGDSVTALGTSPRLRCHHQYSFKERVQMGREKHSKQPRSPDQFHHTVLLDLGSPKMTIQIGSLMPYHPDVFHLGFCKQAILDVRNVRESGIHTYGKRKGETAYGKMQFFW